MAYIAFNMRKSYSFTTNEKKIARIQNKPENVPDFSTKSPKWLWIEIKRYKYKEKRGLLYFKGKAHDYKSLVQSFKNKPEIKTLFCIL